MKNRFIKNVFAVLALYTAMLAIVYFGKEIADGIKQGINLSLNLIIPSLFLFLALADFTMKSGLYKYLSVPFGFLKRPLRLDTYRLSIFILSLIGGYPIGARLLASAVKSNRISSADASRMFCFCTNCGPAFLITAVGIGIYKNPIIGTVIYLSQIIAALVLGFLNKPLQYVISDGKSYSDKISIPSALVSSVTDTIKALSAICGFIVFFSAFMPLTKILFSEFPKTATIITNGLLEVTEGCTQAASLSFTAAVIMTAIFTGFGGICVTLQLTALLRGTGIKLCRFFAMRLVYTAISAAVTWTLLSALPQSVALNTSAASIIIKNGEKIAQTYSSSPICSFFMLLLAVMLLFSQKKSVKI